MEFVRTPESHFENLPDWPYAPHYLEWEGLRVHHIDEGPKDAPVALLTHGEPTWAYLSRKMIQPLLDLGFRVIAPDLAGFGRSDKPVDDNWYVIERHCERLRHLIETLDLKDITVFVQDWGGPTGLRQAVDMAERFSRIVIMNTWLHHEGYAYSDGIKFWRDSACNPLWLAAMEGYFPSGAIVALSAQRPDADREAIRQAYEAPFLDGGESRAGTRRFPWCIPNWEYEAGNGKDQERCFEALKTPGKPVHVIFGDADGVFTAEWGKQWASMIEGATFDTIPQAGHFVQEEAGDEVIEIFARRAGLKS